VISGTGVGGSGVGSGVGAGVGSRVDAGLGEAVRVGRGVRLTVGEGELVSGESAASPPPQATTSAMMHRLRRMGRTNLCYRARAPMGEPKSAVFLPKWLV
jgi:hypothetical protein